MKYLTETDRAVAHAIHKSEIIHIEDFEVLQNEALKLIKNPALSVSERYRMIFISAVSEKNDLFSLLLYLSNTMLRGDGLGVIKPGE